MTPDEQYTHMSLWCLLSAPLFLGGEVQNLDEFTLALLTNDEVIEVDQDSAGRSRGRVARHGDGHVFAKEMDDGSLAVGLFNVSEQEMQVPVKWSDLKITGPRRARDLWRQKDLGSFSDQFEAPVPRHGVVLVRLFPQ
jgi:alpha-galactosidase